MFDWVTNMITSTVGTPEFCRLRSSFGLRDACARSLDARGVAQLPLVGHHLFVKPTAESPAEQPLDGLLESYEFAKMRGWSKLDLAEALAARRVFSVELFDGRMMIPAFFVDARFNQRHIRAVRESLEPLPGGSKWQFFTNGRGSLAGETPLEALLDGRTRAVKASAEGFLER